MKPGRRRQSFAAASQDKEISLLRAGAIPFSSEVTADMHAHDFRARFEFNADAMNAKDRHRKERRREERQREHEEFRKRKAAKGDAILDGGLQSGVGRSQLASGGSLSAEETAGVRKAATDDVSMRVAPIDKQAWQQQAMEAVYEAQQSLWSSILHLSGPHNSSRETQLLTDVNTAATLSADDENALRAVDRHIRSSEMNSRFSVLTKDLKWLKAKIEEYQLVKAMGAA